MLYRLHQHWARARFARAAIGILKTPPVECDPHSGFRLITQLQHVDVMMLLCAVKSLSMFLRPSRITILDDGTLTRQDYAILDEQLRPAEFVRVAELETPNGCPAGGCWERLAYVLESAQDDYVIQLDSDTLFLSRPEEVIEIIRSNHSFTSGTRMGQAFRTLRQAAEEIRAYPGADFGHVQNASESRFDRLKDCDSRRYVRGCAGFAGYAREAIDPAVAQEFSASVSALVGKAKWEEWGSEQVTSNYLIANAPNSIVLPVSRYPFHAPNVALDDAVFVHFLGTYRFRYGTYSRMVHGLIHSLNIKSD